MTTSLPASTDSAISDGCVGVAVDDERECSDEQAGDGTEPDHSRRIPPATDAPGALGDVGERVEARRRRVGVDEVVEHVRPPVPTTGRG